MRHKADTKKAVQQPSPHPQQQQQQRQPRGDVWFRSGSNQDWSLPTGLAVTWLGTSSGAPSRDRNISCTVVRVPGALYPVDCGEGSHRQAHLTGLQLEQLGALVAAMLSGAGVARRLDLPVYVTEMVEKDSDAHGWQPLPGVPSGTAYLRRLAPQPRFHQAEWPADLKARLQRCGMDEQHQQPQNNTTFNGRKRASTALNNCALVRAVVL
eukprot:gene10906-11060_t